MLIYEHEAICNHVMGFCTMLHGARSKGLSFTMLSIIIICKRMWLDGTRAESGKRRSCKLLWLRAEYEAKKYFKVSFHRA